MLIIDPILDQRKVRSTIDNEISTISERCRRLKRVTLRNLRPSLLRAEFPVLKSVEIQIKVDYF